MIIKIPVSIGELADKITILEIKKMKIRDKIKLNAVNNEYIQLINILKKKVKINKEFNIELLKLKKINLRLWNIEDSKRKLEGKKKFDSQFIKLARNVYKFNDKRANIKLNINIITGSKIIEVKSYDEY